MQLILNTDTDIGVQKMSAIQQESLDEKFVNNSLIKNVCDITNENNECIKNKDVILTICERNIEVDKQITHHIETLLDEKNKEDYIECSKIGNKDFKENRENSEIENEDVENSENAADAQNSEVNNKTVLPFVQEGINLLNVKEVKENRKISNQNKDEFIEYSEVDKKNDNEISKQKTLEQNKQHNVSEDKPDDNDKENSEMENENYEQDKQNCKRDNNNQKKDVEMKNEDEKNLLEKNIECRDVVVKILEQNIDESEKDDKIQDQVIENVDMDDKVTENKIENCDMEPKIQEHDIKDNEMHDKIQEQDTENSKIEFKILKKDEECRDVTGKIQEQIIGECENDNNIQDQVKEDINKDRSVTENKIENYDLEDKIHIHDDSKDSKIHKNTQEQNVEYDMMEFEITENVVECRGVVATIQEKEKSECKKDDKIQDQVIEDIEVTESKLEKYDKEAKIQKKDIMDRDMDVKVQEHHKADIQTSELVKQNKIDQGKDKKEVEGKVQEKRNGNSDMLNKIDRHDSKKNNNEIEGSSAQNTSSELEDKDKTNIEIRKQDQIEQGKENINVEDNGENEMDKIQCEEKGKVEGQSKDCRRIVDEIMEQEKNQTQCENMHKEDTDSNETVNKVVDVSSINNEIDGNIDEQGKNNSDIKDKTLIQAFPVNVRINVDKNELEGMSEEICNLDSKSNDQSKDVSQKIETSQENENNIDEKMDVDVEDKSNLQNSNDTEKTFDYHTKALTSQCDEVIDIADEKDEDSECIIDQDMNVMEKESETNINNKDIIPIQNTESDKRATKPTNNEDDELNNKVPCKTSAKNKKEMEQDNFKEIVNNTIIEKNLEEKKKFTHISKLSNTLDILSDEDEDPPNEEPQKYDDIPADKDCNYIEDDDDIMLIDEESNSKDSNNKADSLVTPTNIDLQNEDCKDDVKDTREDQSCDSSTNKKDIVKNEVDTANINVELETNELKQEVTAQEEHLMQPKPLLPVNFLKTCKKNLADMTRDELEEFCVLKIVEGVVDRSNLSEIKSQLTSMAQTIDDYRKKAFTLTKQNRDLQVVLKSIQEEQKKKSNLPITPLKITRSVGMQVLMTDKSGMRRKPSQGQNTPKQNVGNSTPNRPGKGQMNQNSRLQKMQTNVNNNVSPIPVPRLVPAANNNLNNVKIQPPNLASKIQVASSIATVPLQSNIPNGVTTLSPTQKPEKRSLSRMQQNNSDTVDLTDDEPPAKMVAPPVRLVPSQNLIAPNRQPFGSNINSHRKVYIPIGGSQNQAVGVRPGQTIMLKTIAPQGPRQRCPAPAVAKPNQNANTVRMQRMPSRHPAPLPDSMKQYQPPNWKALPPAPELKLSKVENGIVISWKIDGYEEENYEEIASYQLYAYQETSSPPSTALWKKIGDVKALPLPMACTLTQFMAGYKYYFAVRAVDVRSRLGPFSLPGSILLLNKM